MIGNFGEMSVALQVSRHRLESDIIKLRRLCTGIALSDMGTALAIEGFERDIVLVDKAAAVLRELSRYEADVLKLIARKKSSTGVVRRLREVVAAVMF